MKNLLEFIDKNENWLELIQSDPYNITVKRDSGYIMLSYNQISSNFSYPVVWDCRGVILRESDLKPVCVPFTKFFNVQEGHAAKIDWATARVQQKIDGSIIKLWHDDGYWHVSTNGTIDASNASLSMPIDIEGFGRIENFYDLFVYTFYLNDVRFSDFKNKLHPSHTYMFELTSPFNRVVVPYITTQIWHIGTRENLTFRELNINIGVQKPKTYGLTSLEDCLNSADLLPFDDEGYVVVDGNWNRVKIKGVAYVAAHHLKNNGVITMSRIVDLIRVNGQDDFKSIYSEYSQVIEKIENLIKNFLDKVQQEWYTLREDEIFLVSNRKEQAGKITITTSPATLFSLLDKKYKTVEDWLWNQTNERILKVIGAE